MVPSARRTPEALLPPATATPHEGPTMSERPIDLRLLGDYKMAYEHESSESRDDPWLRQIPCEGRGLYVYPAGATELAVSCERRPHIAKRLRAIPGVRLYQD